MTNADAIDLRKASIDALKAIYYVIAGFAVTESLERGAGVVVLSHGALD
jgi:hypothetical protein